MKLSLGPYAKFVTAIIGQAIAFASLYWGGTPDAKYVSIGIAVASALGVYAVPNQPKPSAAAAASLVYPPSGQPWAASGNTTVGATGTTSNVTVVPPAQNQVAP